MSTDIKPRMFILTSETSIAKQPQYWEILRVLFVDEWGVLAVDPQRPSSHYFLYHYAVISFAKDQITLAGQQTLAAKIFDKHWKKYRASNTAGAANRNMRSEIANALKLGGGHAPLNGLTL